MGFSMKLDAPEWDMHDDQILSVARLHGGEGYIQATESGPLDFDLGKKDRTWIFAVYNREGCATMRIA